jgi:hypothetical protein
MTRVAARAVKAVSRAKRGRSAIKEARSALMQSLLHLAPTCFARLWHSDSSDNYRLLSRPSSRRQQFHNQTVHGLVRSQHETGTRPDPEGRTRASD